MLTKEQKEAIVSEFGKDDKDTGSTEVQLALLTQRINELTDHLRNNKMDNHSRRGLYRLIGKRRGLLNYLKKNDIDRYREMLERLNIRG